LSNSSKSVLQRCPKKNVFRLLHCKHVILPGGLATIYWQQALARASAIVQHWRREGSGCESAMHRSEEALGSRQNTVVLWRVSRTTGSWDNWSLVGDPGLPRESRNTMAKRRGQIVGRESSDTLRIALGFFGRDHVGLLGTRFRNSGRLVRRAEFHGRTNISLHG